jgi:hypothetical protein
MRPSNVDVIDGEIWVPLNELTGYFISNLGRIKSCVKCAQYGDNPRLLVGSRDKNGYRRVTIPFEGKRLFIKISSVVALAFLGRRPDGKEIAHIDGDNHNDSAANLCYKTHRENIADKAIHGTVLLGERNVRAKLTREAVLEIRSSPLRPRFLAKKFGVGPNHIWQIRNNKCWRWLSQPAEIST